MNGAPAPAFTEAKEALDRVREVSGSKTDGHRLSAVLVRYLDESTWGREMTKAAAKKVVEEITKRHAYDFAKILSSNFAQKTIKNRISFVAQILTFFEYEGIRRPFSLPGG
jgi:hypothetical protein